MCRSCSESRGMGKDIYRNYSAARFVFESAHNATGVDFVKLMFDGDNVLLFLTEGNLNKN